jgi:hypothetical protein
MKFLSQINVNTEYTLPFVDGANGQVLTTDGNGAVYWGSVSAGSTNLNALTDVVISSPSTGQLLRYGIPVGSEDPNPVWYNWSPNYLTFSSSIDALGDVTISSATTGQILQYNGTAWVNTTLSTVEYVSKVQHIIKAGVAITKGQAVYITGSDGTNMIAGLASNTSEIASSKVMGLAASTAAINGQIFVVTEGLLAGLNTSTATAGDPVWLGANGNLIFGLLGKPTSPLHLVYIGVVTRVQQNNGEIFVKVQNGIEIDEIHDVQISSPATGQLLRRDTDGYWKNWTPNYLTSLPAHTHDDRYYTESEIDAFFGGETAIAGYNQSNWDAAYNDKINSASFATSTGVLTLTQQDLGTVTVDLDGRYLQSFTETDPTVATHVKNITATNISNWNDAFNDSIRSASFNTANGVLTLTQADLGTVIVDLDGRYITSETDSQTLTWTKATSSLAISNGNSVTLEGLATEVYVDTGLDTKVPTTRTLTINGTAFDLSANRSWTISTTETDTLATVTSRGATTNGNIVINGEATIQNSGYLRLIAGSSQMSGFTVFNSAQDGYLSNRITTSAHSRGWGWEFTTNEANNNAGDVFFRVGYNGAVSYLTSGNFGVGTSAPSQKFEVSGGAIIASGFGNRAAGTGKALEIGMDGTSAILQAYDRTASAFIPIVINSSSATFSSGVYASGVWSSSYGPRTAGGNTDFHDWNGNVRARINNAAGVTSVGNRKLSLGILDINSGGSPEIKINTRIPFALGGADFTVNIKGFQYGSSNMVSLSIGWHYYLSQFYNESAISNGSFSPTITLGVETEGSNAGNVVIHLSNVGYWPKLYVESVHSSAYADDYVANWSWSDAGVDGLTSTTVVPYKPLETSITGNAASATNSASLSSDDNRTISPSEAAANQLRFGFTSWGNNNTSPWADYLHLRSYGDSSGGSDNLVMFKKTGIGMRIWQQTFGSSTAYSSYADVWTTGDFTSTNVTNWNTAYGWGNHAGLYAAVSHTHTIANVTGLQTALDGKLSAESDTLDSVTSRGATTSNLITITGSEGREVAVYMPSSYTTDDLVSGHEYGWYSDHWRLGMTRSSATPGADFVVQWNGERMLSLTNGGSLTIRGTFTEQSSIRYKENVKSIPSVSQKVEQLDAVSYNKIGSNQEEIGLIAEDVAELFPEVVKYDNDGRPDGVNYSRLSVILLKAVQELTERVNKLENK